MTVERSKSVHLGRGAGALVVVVALLATVFCAAPLLLASAVELPETFVWWYLLTLVIAFAVCVIAGWVQISAGDRPLLGFALLFGSVLFFLPYLTWFFTALGDAIRES